MKNVTQRFRWWETLSTGELLPPLLIFSILVLPAALFLGVAISSFHPWVEPRPIWLWGLFLTLTIYPAIKGALDLYDADTYYPSLVFRTFMMFWLGNIIAKDISAVRRVFQLLAVFALFIAIHTIIEATTGKFLFESARAEATIAQSSNYQLVQNGLQIVGASVSRSGSFFGHPNGNGTFLAISFFLPLGLFIESKQLWAKMIYLLEMLLLLLALMFTYSTGAWIALLAGMLAFVIFVGQIRSSLLLLMLIALLTVIVFTVFPLQLALQLSHTSANNESSLHIGGWQTALRVTEAALEELHLPHTKGAPRKDRRTLLALTFDDGYYDNYTHAFALASELQIPITIFLIPGYLDRAHSFWWADRLIRHAQIDQVSFEGHTYYLDQQDECKALARIIDDHISNAASVAEREQSLTTICEILSVPYSAISKEEPAPLLPWTQVREMEESGWVSFGAHTIHHPDLARLTNPVEVQREVGACRIMLEQQLGHSVDTFAYPYGRIGDHGLCPVEQAGYKWAVTTEPGFNTPQSNPLLLRRREADSDRHVLVVAAETAGLWSFFNPLKRIAKLIIRPLPRTSTMQRHSDGSRTEKERITV